MVLFCEHPECNGKYDRTEFSKRDTSTNLLKELLAHQKEANKQTTDLLKELLEEQKELVGLMTKIEEHADYIKHDVENIHNDVNNIQSDVNNIQNDIQNRQ